MENDPVLREKILHKGGYMAREAVKQAIDQFVLAHPEIEQEVLQAIMSARKEMHVEHPAFSASTNEREIQEVFSENATENSS
jgi:siroheme synthase